MSSKKHDGDIIENGFEIKPFNKSVNEDASVNLAKILFSHFANYFVSITSIRIT